MQIDIIELCEALGVEYDSAKSKTFYLMLVKEYRLRYIAAQQSATQNIGVCPQCGAGLHEDHKPTCDYRRR